MPQLHWTIRWSEDRWGTAVTLTAIYCCVDALAPCSRKESRRSASRQQDANKNSREQKIKNNASAKHKRPSTNESTNINTNKQTKHRNVNTNTSTKNSTNNTKYNHKKNSQAKPKQPTPSAPHSTVPPHYRKPRQTPCFAVDSVYAFPSIYSPEVNVGPESLRHGAGAKQLIRHRAELARPRPCRPTGQTVFATTVFQGSNSTLGAKKYVRD